MMPVNSLLESVVLSQVDCCSSCHLTPADLRSDNWSSGSTFVEVLTHIFISFMGSICQSIIYWTLGSIVTLNWFAHWWLADCLLMVRLMLAQTSHMTHDSWMTFHWFTESSQHFNSHILEDGERLLTLHGHGGSEEAAARGLHPWYVHMLWGKWCWCGVDWQIHSWQTLLEWISDLAGQEEERITFPHFTEHLDINYASLLVTCHV